MDELINMSMEGKEIIENMSKGTVYAPQNDDKSTTNMKRVWIKTKSGNWAFVVAYGLTGNESFANSELICEAFNVANKTGLTPSQLHLELEKAKELIKLGIGWATDQEGSSYFIDESTTFLEGSGNKTK